MHQILRELPARFRLWVVIDLPPNRITELAAQLGYTEGILIVHEEEFDNEELNATAQGRWWRGWFRRNSKKVFQEELYLQDEVSWWEQSPHNRRLKVEHQGAVVERVGHRSQRGLSPLDAKFLFNMTCLSPKSRILDPFAGFGGIVLEGQRRGMHMVAADWEASLVPGLSETCRGHYVVADARKLPFRPGIFDAIITEPPYRSSCRKAVLASLPMIHQMVPQGHVTLFIAEDMYEAVSQEFQTLGRKTVAEHWIRRNRGLRCVALCFQ